MRVEMRFDSYVEVFNRLIAVHFDIGYWQLRAKKTPSSILVYVGPFTFGYTNQKSLHERMSQLLADVEKDLENYQVKDRPEVVTVETPNILH